jgi:hypothetical protein
MKSGHECDYQYDWVLQKQGKSVSYDMKKVVDTMGKQ